MTLWQAFVLVAAAGVLVLLLSTLGLRVAGADLRTGRRLAGAPEVRVGTLLDGRRAPERPLRVVGRVRCSDPLENGGDRLVVYHRDVEVRFPGTGWRTVERLREARSFELWDHDGSLTIDPSRAFEPLITLPSVWRGAAAELVEPHASAVKRLQERYGAPAAEARATTRSVNLTDRLLVLARVTHGPNGGPMLHPPEGGYLVTNLGLDDAMRLLGGRHRRLTAVSVIGLGVGGVLAAVGFLGAVVGAALRL